MPLTWKKVCWVSFFLKKNAFLKTAVYMYSLRLTSCSACSCRRPCCWVWRRQSLWSCSWRGRRRRRRRPTWWRARTRSRTWRSWEGGGIFCFITISHQNKCMNKFYTNMLRDDGLRHLRNLERSSLGNKREATRIFYERIELRSTRWGSSGRRLPSHFVASVRQGRTKIDAKVSKSSFFCWIATIGG